MARLSTLLKILDDTKVIVQALKLPGIVPSSVVVAKTPVNSTADLQQDKYPCLIIAPWKSKGLDKAGGTNGQRDVTYPVVIVSVSQAPQNSPLGIDDLDQPADWTEILTNVFDQNRHTLPLATATTVFNSYVQPLETIEDAALLGPGMNVCGIVVNFESRELRATYTGAAH